MGSIPIVGTIFYYNAPVAELADAPDLGSGTSVWGFKSLQAHHYNKNRALIKMFFFLLIILIFSTKRDFNPLQFFIKKIILVIYKDKIFTISTFKFANHHKFEEKAFFEFLLANKYAIYHKKYRYNS